MAKHFRSAAESSALPADTRPPKRHHGQNGSHGAHGARNSQPRNVFTRYTLRSLRANRVRTLVTIVGVALATGLLMAVLSSVTSLRSALIESTGRFAGIWQLSFTYDDASALDKLRDEAGDHLDRLATRRDLGAVALSDEAVEEHGPYLGLFTLAEEQGGGAETAGGGANGNDAANDDRLPVYPEPAVVRGRLPEKPGEIALANSLYSEDYSAGYSTVAGTASGLVSDGPIELGSEVTIAAGRRVYLADGEAIDSNASLFGDYDYVLDPDGETYSISAGQLDEHLTDIGEPRSYVVVGFVNGAYLDGFAAYVCPDEVSATASHTDVNTAFVSTTGYTSYDELCDLATRTLGEDAGFVTNDSLLTYQGLSQQRMITDSLMQFAAVLAVVVVAAAISLISNAFTISISERTRQFGLLSSLGASRRQLRHTVFTEAALIGGVGIPLGLVIGVAATAAVFALTGEGWAFMLGDAEGIRLVVAPADVLISVLLSVVVLFVSALIPAVRASRVPAVDAIRQARDVRPSKRLKRTFSRRRDVMDDFSADGKRPRGLAARLGGIPAFLARRTLRVSGGKNRVAASALAISVALLVSAGLAGGYLTGSLTFIDYGDADLEAYVSAEDSSPSTLQDVSSNPAFTQAERVIADMDRLDGIDRAWVLASSFGRVHLSSDDVNWDAIAAYNERFPSATFSLSQEGYAFANVYLLDDATWQALADEIGLSDEQADPAQLSCVALNATRVTDQSTYGMVSPLTGTGSEIGLIVDGEYADDEWIGFDDEKNFGLVRSDGQTGATSLVAPMDELGLEEVRVPVAATVDSLGDSFPLSFAQLTDTSNLVYLMPLKAILSGGAGQSLDLGALQNGSVAFEASFAEGADEEVTISAVRDIIDETEGIYCIDVYNIAESMSDARSMSFTVNVFLYSFTAVTLAIAVANVFNTIASGLMLRTREFATLQSAGMGRRGLRRMIFFECLDFAIKGLIGGIVLAGIVDVAFWMVLRGSISTLSIALPWGHVAFACAVVVAVLLVSVVYALRKTHAMNLVEALRADAV